MKIKDILPVNSVLKNINEMNKSIFLFVLGFCIIVSCNNKKKSSMETEKTAQAVETTENVNSRSATPDLDKIPVTTENIGEFPYLSAPENYGYSDGKTKEYEEKLFFYNDSLTHKVEGKYYHAKIYPNENVEFSETYVVNNYKKAIEKLGGVEIYSGTLPGKITEKIFEENLPYMKDLYDPFPYQYKQFLIKTPTDNIWMELIHGLNTQMIDFTVVKEETVK